MKLTVVHYRAGMTFPRSCYITRSEEYAHQWLKTSGYDKVSKERFERDMDRGTSEEKALKDYWVVCWAEDEENEFGIVSP